MSELTDQLEKQARDLLTDLRHGYAESGAFDRALIMTALADLLTRVERIDRNLGRFEISNEVEMTSIPVDLSTPEEAGTEDESG